MVDQESIRALRNWVERKADSINERHGGIIDRVRKNFAVELTVRVVRELSEDDVTHMAAGVAYYVLFSIFPLLLVMISVMSYFMEPAQIEAHVGSVMGSFLPGSDQFVSENIETVIRLRGALTLFAFLGMLWSASNMFGALNRAINRAWDIHNDRPIYLGKPRQLLMALSMGSLFGLSITSATIVRTADDITSLGVPVISEFAHVIGQVIFQSISLSLMIVIFLLMYKLMPNTQTHWRYIWPGAIISAVIFEISKNLFIIYISSFASYQDVYGSIAPVMVLLFWTFVSSMNVLLGAEICSEYERMKHDIERGVVRHSRHAPARVPSGPH